MNARSLTPHPLWLALFAALGLSVVAMAQMALPTGDIDGDFDVDRDDITMLVAARSTPASGPDDPRDLDGDGQITVLDARIAATLCTEPLCELAVTCFNFEARDAPVDPVFEPCLNDADPPCYVRDGDSAEIYFATTTAGGVKTGIEINERSREVMQIVATALMTYPGPTYILEGHAAECGTNEENLALGQRRAESVLNYMISLGISGSRFKVISYGEERPFCTESTTECWPRNALVRFIQVGN